MGKTRIQRDYEFTCKCYFRWEFIRRNFDYRTDYSWFRRRFGRWFKRRGADLAQMHSYHGIRLDHFLDTHPESEEYFFTTIQPYVEAFDHKWGVNWPCDPNFSVDSVESNEALQLPDDTILRIPVSNLESDLKLDMTLDSIVEDQMERERQASNDQTWLKEARKIDKQAEADNAPLRFTVIPRLGKVRNQERFSRFLQQIDWEKYRRPKPHSSDTKRPRLNEYLEYLRVWDCRQKNANATWPDVARLLYAEDFRKYATRRDLGIRNAVIQRGVDRYKRAEELINGGFQEIT